MTGSQTIGSDLTRNQEQLIKLQMVVAQAARDGRAAGEILTHEGAHDFILEPALLVYDVVRNANRFRDAACIVNIVKGTATSLDRLGHSLPTGQPALIPELHREPDYVVAFTAKLRRDGRGIDTT